MELLFDYLRVANALDARMKAELPMHGINELQMWLLLLIGGLLRGPMRGRKSLSANDAAVELCVPRTRAATQITKLAKRRLVAATKEKSNIDGRTGSFVLTEDGLHLAWALRKLLQTIEKDVLTGSGWRATDRAVDPQYAVMGFWLIGSTRGRLPTLTRLENAPSAYAPGDERGDVIIRLAKAQRP